MKTTDNINRPSHYIVGGYECMKVIEALDLGFHLGNVMKYIWRAGRKGDELEDLKKARVYLDRKIALMEGGQVEEVGQAEEVDEWVAKVKNDPFHQWTEEDDQETEEDDQEPVDIKTLKSIEKFAYNAYKSYGGRYAERLTFDVDDYEDLGASVVISLDDNGEQVGSVEMNLKRDGKNVVVDDIDHFVTYDVVEGLWGMYWNFEKAVKYMDRQVDLYDPKGKRTEQDKMFKSLAWWYEDNGGQDPDKVCWQYDSRMNVSVLNSLFEKVGQVKMNPVYSNNGNVERYEVAKVRIDKSGSKTYRDATQAVRAIDEAVEITEQQAEQEHEEEAKDE